MLRCPLRITTKMRAIGHVQCGDQSVGLSMATSSPPFQPPHFLSISFSYSFQGFPSVYFFLFFFSFFMSFSNPIHRYIARLMLDQLSRYLDNILFTFSRHYGYNQFIKTLLEISKSHLSLLYWVPQKVTSLLAFEGRHIEEIFLFLFFFF